MIAPSALWKFSCLSFEYKMQQSRNRIERQNEVLGYEVDVSADNSWRTDSLLIILVLYLESHDSAIPQSVLLSSLRNLAYHSIVSEREDSLFPLIQL